jgi:hypothetical protein
MGFLPPKDVQRKKPEGHPERLTKEAVHIVNLSRGPEDSDLNAKSEWGQARIPKLGVSMPLEKAPAPHTPAQFHLTNPEYA